MPLTTVEKSILLAAYYRGGSQDERQWTSNTDQILTLSLFFTGDITSDDCVGRFSKKSYVQKLYLDDGELTEEIKTRYMILIEMVKGHAGLIQGGGCFDPPPLPTYSACRLTVAGLQLALSFVKAFPRKPEFPNWPDQRE